MTRRLFLSATVLLLAAPMLNAVHADEMFAVVKTDYDAAMTKWREEAQAARAGCREAW